MIRNKTNLESLPWIQNNFSLSLQELYRRYLYNPDTWTVGLQKHLKKSIIREKTNKFSNASHQYPLPVYRPKALLIGDQMSNGAATTAPTATIKRRILSANYPAASARMKTRIQSAASTMSRFRAPPPLEWMKNAVGRNVSSLGGKNSESTFLPDLKFESDI